MGSTWPMVPLTKVLRERREVPSPDALARGDVRVVAKIGFNNGVLQLRADTETKTDMILICPGDLVVSGINAAKGAIAVYGEQNASPVAATIHYGAYVPDKASVHTQYLWWLLRSATFRDLLLKHVPGGIKTELKASRLLAVPVPLPPLSEQQRIVSCIDALAAKIAEARRVREQAADAPEGVITSALTRLLSPFVADGSLSDILLMPPRNGWSCRCDNLDSGVPVLTLTAVTGYTYRPGAVKRTSEATIPGAHYWLRSGDLLVTRSNTPGLVGHAAIYNGIPSPCIYPDLMMRLAVDEAKADKRFVHLWLRSAQARSYIARVAKGTSPTMKKISGRSVMNMPYPARLPLSEQRRIVAYLDGLQVKVHELKRLQAETAGEMEALLPSVLERAFKGDL